VIASLADDWLPALSGNRLGWPRPFPAGNLLRQSTGARTPRGSTLEGMLGVRGLMVAVCSLFPEET
jgi:hypothetical protein